MVILVVGDVFLLYCFVNGKVLFVCLLFECVCMFVEGWMIVMMINILIDFLKFEIEIVVVCCI